MKGITSRRNVVNEKFIINFFIKINLSHLSPNNI